MMTNCLWVPEGKALEVANYYCAIFKNSQVKSHNAWTCSFELNGQAFVALQGGDQFNPNEAVSFMVACEDQSEIDQYWHALTTDGGQEQACGWLKDKYGFSWQIIPNNLNQLLQSPQAMQALMDQKKIIIEQLMQA